MKNTFKKNILISSLYSAIFVLFTIMVKFFDVAPAGATNTNVGFSKINSYVFNAINSIKNNELFYNLSEILGYFALGVAFVLVLFAAVELLKNKSFKKVNTQYYVLAGLYAAVVFFYVFFEKVIINYRPVLVENQLEASYPSSHTLLSLSILLSAIIIIDKLFKSNKLTKLSKIVLFAVMILIVVFRLLSNVHWFTDIVGGILLSISLVSFYYTFSNKLN